MRFTGENPPLTEKPSVICCANATSLFKGGLGDVFYGENPPPLRGTPFCERGLRMRAPLRLPSQRELSAKLTEGFPFPECTHLLRGENPPPLWGTPFCERWLMENQTSPWKFDSERRRAAWRSSRIESV